MTFDRRRLAIFAAGFSAFLIFYAPQAVLPQLADSFGVSPAAVGSLVGATTLAVAFSAPFIGLLADRLGFRRVIVASAFLLAVPTLALIEATDLGHMLLWRFAQGLCLPAIFSVTVALIAEEWGPGEAVDVTGVYIAASALGGFAGRFITALLAAHWGWRAGFSALTLLALLCAFAMWRWLPAGRRPVRGESNAGPNALTALKLHLTNRKLLPTFAIGFALLFAMVAVFTYVNFRLVKPPFNFGPTELGLIFLVYPVGVVTAPFSGPVIRRLGRRVTMLLALLLAASGLAVSLIAALPAMAAGLAAFVTGIFFAQSASTGFVGQNAPVARSTALGLYVCCYYLGGSFGSLVPGLIWTRLGWPGCVALVVAVLGGAGLLAWLAWGEETKPAPAIRQGCRGELAPGGKACHLP